MQDLPKTNYDLIREETHSLKMTEHALVTKLVDKFTTSMMQVEPLPKEFALAKVPLFDASKSLKPEQASPMASMEQEAISLLREERRKEELLIQKLRSERQKEENERHLRKQAEEADKQRSQKEL